jgi:hypothetical protein
VLTPHCPKRDFCHSLNRYWAGKEQANVTVFRASVWSFATGNITTPSPSVIRFQSLPRIPVKGKNRSGLPEGHRRCKAITRDDPMFGCSRTSDRNLLRATVEVVHMTTISSAGASDSTIMAIAGDGIKAKGNGNACCESWSEPQK